MAAGRRLKGMGGQEAGERGGGRNEWEPAACVRCVSEGKGVEVYSK